MKKRLVNNYRILFLVRSGQLGGMELRLAEIAAFLVSRGHRVDFRIGSFPGCREYLNALRGDGVQPAILEVPPFMEKWRWRRLNRFRARFLTAPHVARLDPDLVHVPFAWTDQGLSRLWLARTCNVPAVASIHGFFNQHNFSEERVPVVAYAMGALKGVYAISQAAAERFIDVFGPYIPRGIEVRVIHNAVDTEKFAPSVARRSSARTSWRVDVGDMVIGCVGRLSQEKQPVRLLEAFSLILQQVPNARLVFIGDGEMAPDVRRVAVQMGIGERVIITGFVDDVENWLPGLDMHLLISRGEGFGTVTAEAMASGVPAAGTGVGGTRDILEGSSAGVVLYDDAPESVANTLLPLLRNKGRLSSMSRAGRAEALARFSKPRWYAQLGEFYDDALKS